MPATATPAVSPRRPDSRFTPNRGPRGNGSASRGRSSPASRAGVGAGAGGGGGTGNGSFRRGGQSAGGAKPRSADHEILFQKFFKSVGPRTYAGQVKRATNGNQYLVLTEGKREADSAEVRKTRLFVYSEDFVEFFRLIKSAAEFIKANPLPADVQQKRQRFWEQQKSGAAAAAATSPAVAKAPAAR